MKKHLVRLYDTAVFDRPGIVLFLVVAVVLFFAAFVPRFSLDASSDSLVLETDDDLRYYRSIRARYGSDDYLIVTYTPESPLFEEDALEDLRALRDGLAGLERVDSVTSLLDIPLLESPAISLDELPEGIRRLEASGTDRQMARREVLASPLYRNLIISPDGRTTALRVDFEEDLEFRDLWDARDNLREERLERELSDVELAELRRLDEQVRDHNQTLLEEQQEDIAAVRAVMARHSGNAKL
ncbi:MAG: transporter, partial [Gammaproteobacteria bacterium]